MVDYGAHSHEKKQTLECRDHQLAAKPVTSETEDLVSVIKEAEKTTQIETFWSYSRSQGSSAFSCNSRSRRSLFHHPTTH